MAEEDKIDEFTNWLEDLVGVPLWDYQRTMLKDYILERKGDVDGYSGSSEKRASDDREDGRA